MTKTIRSISRLRRWALLLGSLLGTGALAQGQTLNYATTTATNVAGTYTDLGATGTVISTNNPDDANSAAQNIGFSFSYNGASFTQFVLNTNGLVRLGANAPSAANMFIQNETPATNPPGVDPVTSTSAADVNLLMPFNFDLEAGTGASPGPGFAEYRVATTGTSPNQVCTIQWKNVYDKAATNASQYGSFNFQVKLYEGTNRIEFVYSAATAAATGTEVGRYATIGVKGSGSATGQLVLASKGSSATAWSAATFISAISPRVFFRRSVGPDTGRTFRFDTGTLAVPTNDDCAGAITLTPGSTCTATAGTTVGATQSLAPINCGGFTGTSDDDVWYKFVATATAHTVTVVGSASFDATVDVRSGTCASSTNIGCADAFITGGTETATLGGLTVGSTYFVRVYSYDAVPGTFTVCVTGVVAAPANDNPTGAVALTVGTTCTPTTGTNAGATTTTASGYVNPGTCGIAASPKDVWYSFTTLAGQTAATVTVTGAPAGLVRVFSAASSAGPFTQVGCAAGSTNNTVAGPVSLTGLTGNTTYYISVAGYGSNDTQGAFTICVTSGSTATTCAAVTNAAVVNTGGNATAVSAQLSFTAVTGATSYAITLAPTGSTGTPVNLTGSPINLTGLTPSTSYTVTIVTNCSTGGTSSPVSVVFTSAAAPAAPANNDCAGAITLTSATTCAATTGTTNGATQSLAAIACGGFTGASDDDVWYKFVATAASHTVTVVGAGSFDPVVDVRSGICASSANIGCADATTAGGTETATLAGLTVGSTYFVRVYSYDNGLTGTFTICVTGATPVCPAPTGLTAGSITTTGATLTFTAPAAGATGYTVTYTAAGGTAQTQAATGSPVVLTGLTSGTAYTVSVVTNCGAGQTSTAATTTFTTLTPCNAPTGLTAGSITTTGATLTFTAPAAGATGYTVTYTAAGGTAQTQAATGSPVVLTGLTSGTAYTVSVVTNCGAGQTSAATTTTFTTLAPCTAVTSLATSNVTTTSATLTFTGASAGTSYTVTYTAAGGTAQTQTATGSPVTLANLTPATAYTVSVVTNCGSSQVSPSASTTFTTLTPCNAPTGLTAGSITTTGATLTFTAPAAGATGYTVTYTAAGGTAQTQAATGSPVVLTGLTSGTAYTVSVVTNCGAGQTSAATSTTFTTLVPCNAPTALTAGSITATGAVLTFTGASAGTSYTVTYTAAGGTAQTQTATGSPVTLTGLQAGKQYTVSIVTNCGAGQISSATTTTFTTLAPAPTNAVAGSITATGASISFTAAAGATNYTVTYTAAGGTAQTQTATASPVVLTGLTGATAYTVTIVANYPGGGTSSPVTVTFTTPLGTAVRTTLGSGELSVYPNPARESFTVSLPALGTARTAQVELVNMLGQTISRQTVSLTAGGTRVPFDATGLATGVYSVRVRVEGETAITRLVLE